MYHFLPAPAFNPILVWFYLCSVCKKIKVHFCFFQSHFGLILSVKKQLDGIKVPTFQSHFGLILSHHKGPKDSQGLSFNPILVWFYLVRSAQQLEKRKNFQSHFGLILSLPLLSKNIIIFSSFNPILVWFYLPAEWVKYRPRPSLSIPFWSDFILMNKLPEDIIKKYFQSHFGLILSNRCSKHCAWQHSLSIPFWSDFIRLEFWDCQSMQ